MSEEEEGVPQRKRKSRRTRSLSPFELFLEGLPRETFAFNGPKVFHSFQFDELTLDSTLADRDQLTEFLKRISPKVRWEFANPSDISSIGYNETVSSWTNTLAVTTAVLSKMKLDAKQIVESVKATGTVQYNTQYLYVLSMCGDMNMAPHYDPLPGVVYFLLDRRPDSKIDQIIMFIEISGDNATDTYKKLGLEVPVQGKREQSQSFTMDLGRSPPPGWNAAPPVVPSALVERLSASELSRLTVSYYTLKAPVFVLFNGGVAHYVWNLTDEKMPIRKIGLNFAMLT